MTEKFVAFMSYAQFDDEHERGNLTEIRKQLAGEVRMQTGEEFEIFQDKKDLKWGDNWRKRIEESVNQTTFLMPIVTPSFFRSQPCREELQIFLEREKRLKREDLIFPIYYMDCQERKEDSLAKVIFSRQYSDWRELRFESSSSPTVRKKIFDLAIDIRKAMKLLQEQQFEADKARVESDIPLDIPQDANFQDKLITGFQIYNIISLNLRYRDRLDYVVMSENDMLEKYVVLFSYDFEENRWRNMWRRKITDASVEVIVHRMPSMDRDILIVKTTAGSGAFMDYDIKCFMDGQLKTMLSRSGIFQGSLLLHADQIIEKRGHQATLFQWNGALMLGIPLVSEPHPPYSSINVKRIDFTIDESDEVSLFPEAVTMHLGEKVLLVRNNTGPSERVLYSDDGILHYHGGYFVAIGVGDTSIRIIPSGYNHEKAVQIQVKVEQ